MPKIAEIGTEGLTPKQNELLTTLHTMTRWYQMLFDDIDWTDEDLVWFTGSAIASWHGGRWSKYRIDAMEYMARNGLIFACKVKRNGIEVWQYAITMSEGASLDAKMRRKLIKGTERQLAKEGMF